jgi:DNA polymerase (family 10)
MTNAEVAALLREMAIFLDMAGVQFKPRAYERVADTIDALDEPIDALFAQGGVKALARLQGVG